MSDNTKIAKLEEDIMFFRSFKSTFNPRNMSWEELYSRLVIAYEGYEALERMYYSEKDK